MRTKALSERGLSGIKPLDTVLKADVVEKLCMITLPWLNMITIGKVNESIYLNTRDTDHGPGHDQIHTLDAYY